MPRRVSLRTATWAEAMLAGAFVLVPVGTSAAEPDWTPVFRGDLRLELVESGEIEAVRSQRVLAPTVQQSSLQIVSLVPEGIAVEAGDTLVVFDGTPLALLAEEVRTTLEREVVELRRVEAEQESRWRGLESTLQSAQFAMEQADLQVEKLEYESEARREEARLAWKKARVSLDAARTKLEAQAVLDSLESSRIQRAILRYETRLAQIQGYAEELTLVAPIDGLVVYAKTGWRADRRKIRLGDEVQPGAPVVEIPDLSLMDVVFDVHEVDRERVADGMLVEVTLRAYPGEVFPASVLDLAPLALAPESESNVRLFSARARIEGSSATLKPGMSAQVVIELDTVLDTLLVPLGALLEQDGAPVVLPRSTWPAPRQVRLGPWNPEAAVVLEGLQEGEEVAVRNLPPMPGVRPFGYAEFQAGPGRWEQALPGADPDGALR